MKNKRLIILLSVFAFLVLIAVLCSTVFTVRVVSVDWVTNKVSFDVADSEIANDVKKGESVFLVNKKSIKEKLEADYPYIKITGLEIKFPNKLVVHAAERQELYSIKIKDNLHYILDGEGKVLRKSDDANLNGAIPITMVDYQFEEKSFEIAKIADLGVASNVISSLTKACYANNYADVDIKNNISDVSIDVSGYNANLTITLDKVNIKINKLTVNLLEKIKLGVAVYDKRDSAERANGFTITVYDSPTEKGKVVAEYSPE